MLGALAVSDWSKFVDLDVVFSNAMRLFNTYSPFIANSRPVIAFDQVPRKTT